MGQTTVLITTEGTYPCYSGGVSVWCDLLIRELAEVDFHVFSLTHAPSLRPRYELPPNVKSCRLHPIWGTEEPGIGVDDFESMYRRKLQTTSERVRRDFLPAFERALVEIFSHDPNPESLGHSLLAIYQYCRECDYTWSVRSPEAWEAFVKAASRSHLDLSLQDATDCMRWMLRFLSVLSVEYPEVDLVHSSIATTAGLPGVICKLRSGSSYLLTEHGLHLREIYLSLSQSSYSSACRAFLLSFYRALCRLNYHFADRITALGKFNQRWQIRLGADPSKIVVIPNGVDPQRFYPPQVPTNNPRPVVLVMARISPIKGIDTLIRAAAIVRERIPDVLFRIMGEVGDSAYHAECLRLMDRLQLGDSIEFGHTNDSSAAYRDADIVCLPSRSEGVPFTVIEAMLSGCPVVANDVGCVADMIGTDGTLVKPNCPESLAAALVRVLKTPREAQKVQADAARRRALRNFTIASFGTKYRATYGELTHEDPRLFEALA